MKICIVLCVLILGCQAQTQLEKKNVSSTDLWLLQNLGDNDLFKQTEQSSLNTQTGSTDQSVINSALYCKQGSYEGICVKPSECLGDKEEIDLEKLDVFRHKNCHYLKVCCPVDKVINATKTPDATAPSGVTGTSTLPKKKAGCGWSNPGTYDFRTSSNSHANYGEFPWMVAIMKKSSGNDWVRSDYLGGGSLIHPSVVLTVAHKVKDVRNDSPMINCRLGEWDTQTTNEVYPHQDRNVKKIIVHESFNPKISAFDVALLIVKIKFDLTDPHIGIACLGISLPKPGTRCYSMGWGQHFKDKKDYAVYLKKVPLPLVDKNSCEYSLQNTALGSRYRLHNTLLCAGGEVGLDTCKGDGGAPLVCAVSDPDEDDVRYSVFGMVAFGVSCGTNIPGVYVNVPYFVGWIIGKCQEENINIQEALIN